MREVGWDLDFSGIRVQSRPHFRAVRAILVNEEGKIMPDKSKKDDTVHTELVPADEQVARLVDLISSQFSGDTSRYFESVSHASPTRDEESDERGSVLSFLRCYR